MTLTAVERFSNRHDDDLVPAAGSYRARLPVTAPLPGQQYAFEVDLDACTGCKACVTACHSMNGLDPGESWRAVGLLVGTTDAYQQTVTTGCHHCESPACMSGCPVDAYEKDDVTGIVSHLDDQCIGCRYCTLTCPYEVPRFNSRLGIVRKCDLCAPRLAIGESPACVQGCPTGAISITTVDRGARREWPIPESPSPAHTRPTTVYRSTRPVPESAIPADHFEVRPAASHTPLAVMLVLSQLAVGAFVAEPDRAVAALLAVVAAMAASVAHLGRPLLAWRAVIGLRHSWVSREIVAFSAFTALAAAHAALLLLGVEPPLALPLLAGATGVAGIACSVAIYAATGRRWWGAGHLSACFALATASSGLGVALATRPTTGLAAALIVLTVVRLTTEATVLRHRRTPLTELGRTAVLLTGELRPDVQRRLALAVAGGIAAPMLTVSSGWTIVAVVGLALVVAGDVVERTLLFTASAAPRMPGGRR